MLKIPPFKNFIDFQLHLHYNHVIIIVSFLMSTETVCNKLFERKYRLEEHYKNVHEQLGYNCVNCDYKTRNQELFNEHLIEHSTTNRRIQHYIYNTTDTTPRTTK